MWMIFKQLSKLFNSLCLQTNNHSVQSLLDSMVSKYLANKGYHSVNKLVSGNFSAMVTLREASKNPDLVLNFAKCIYDKRSGTDNSLMQLNRMPFALIEYQIQFFTASYVNTVNRNVTRNILSLYAYIIGILLIHMKLFIKGRSW